MATASVISPSSDQNIRDKNLYFIQCNDGPIKIGITNNVEYRLRQLQQHNPFNLKVLLTTPATFTDETHVHKLLKNSHIRGEWYTSTEEVWDFIKSLKLNGGLLPIKTETQIIFESRLTITPRQEQIVLGSLLGNGYLIRPPNANCFLVIHEQEKESWLSYKAKELWTFQRLNSKFEKKNKTLYWKSRSSKLWNKYYKLCYPYNNNKKRHRKVITDEWLYSIKDVALATWFCDRGVFLDDGRIELRSSYYGENGSSMLSSYLNKCEIPCAVIEKNIVLTNEGSDKFLRIISPQLPMWILKQIQKEGK